MSDSSSTSVSFPIPVNSIDKRLLPEIIADHYGFPLACHKVHNTHYYAVLDWIRGVSQQNHPHRYWSDLKRRCLYLKRYCLELPYRATNQKTYQVDFADSVGLFEITQRMGRKIGIVRHILEGTLAIEENAGGGVYIFSIEEMPGYYKIGVSRNVKKRLYGCDLATPLTIVLEYFVEHPEYRSVERALHRIFEMKRVKGEWFLLSSGDIESIKNILADIPTGQPLLPDKTENKE